MQKDGFEAKRRPFFHPEVDGKVCYRTYSSFEGTGSLNPPETGVGEEGGSGGGGHPHEFHFSCLDVEESTVLGLNS